MNFNVYTNFWLVLYEDQKTRSAIFEGGAEQSAASLISKCSQGVVHLPQICSTLQPCYSSSFSVFPCLVSTIKCSPQQRSLHTTSRDTRKSIAKMDHAENSHYRKRTLTFHLLCLIIRHIIWWKSILWAITDSCPLYDWLLNV